MSELVIAEDQAKAEALCRHSTGASGQGIFMKELGCHAVARKERSDGKWRGYDHIHLARYDGTKFVQWHGRSASGYHHGLGRIMQIIPSDDEIEEIEHALMDAPREAGPEDKGTR